MTATAMAVAALYEIWINRLLLTSLSTLTCAPRAARLHDRVLALVVRVENIYDTCQRLMDAGVTINRPPRDGHMAFVRSPDGISIELHQKGGSLGSWLA